MSLPASATPQASSADPVAQTDQHSPRGRVVKSLLLLAAGVAALAVLNLARLDRLTGDQFTLLAVVQDEADSNVFERDGLFQGPPWYKAYLPWYRALAFHLTQWTGDGAVGLCIMSIGLTAGMALAFWLLFYWLGIDPVLASCGALLGVLPRAATGSELSGAGIIEAALPRTFFSVGLPLAIFLILKSHQRGPWCIAGFFLLGLLGNFHPQSAFFATASLLLLILFQRCLEWRTWVQVSFCGAAAVVGVLPFTLTFPWEATSSQPVASTEEDSSRLEALQNLLVAGGNAHAETEDSAEVATEVESTEYPEVTEPIASEGGTTEESAEGWWEHSQYVLSMMNYKITFPIFLLTVLPLPLAVWWVRPAQQDPPGSLTQAAQFCYLAAVLICCLSLGSEIANRILGSWELSIPFLDSVQPLRATRLVAPLSITAFILFLSNTKGWEFLNSGRVRLAGLLLIIPVGISMAGGEYVFQTRYKPVREAARWAKENTEPGTLFLVDPPSAIAFRVWSNRPVVWAKHDAVCVASSRRSQTRDEIREIERVFQKPEPYWRLRLARQYGADYVQYDTPEKLTLPPGSQQIGPFLSLLAASASERVATPAKATQERSR